eukprot:403367814
MKENQDYLMMEAFMLNYGDSKITTELMTSPTFMTEFLILHNRKEFYHQDQMDTSQGFIRTRDQENSQNFNSENFETSPIQVNESQMHHQKVNDLNGKKFSMSSLERDGDSQLQKEKFDHLLQLIKQFFKKRMLDGKNLFKILGKYSDQEDIRFKIFELVFMVSFFCKDIQNDLDFYYTKNKSLNIFNNAMNHLHQDCNPMLTKCIFQVLGESLKQFTLIDVDECMPFIGQEEIFMRKANKINLNESNFIDQPYSNIQQSINQNKQGSQSQFNKKPKLQLQDLRNSNRQDDLIIGQSQLGFNTGDFDNTRGQTTQPSINWKELSIDNTFNLTPKLSPRSPDNNEEFTNLRNDKTYQQNFRLGTINSARDEEEMQIKLEQLEQQIFTFQSENQALKKSIDLIQDELVSAKEKEESLTGQFQDLEEDYNTLEFELKSMTNKFIIIENKKIQIEKQLQSQEKTEQLLDSHRQQNNELKAENDNLAHEISFLRQQIEELESQIDKKDKELEKNQRAGDTNRVSLIQQNQLQNQNTIPSNLPHLNQNHHQLRMAHSFIDPNPFNSNPLRNTDSLQNEIFEQLLPMINQNNTQIAQMHQNQLQLQNTIIQNEKKLKPKKLKVSSFGCQIQEENLGIFTKDKLKEKRLQLSSLKMTLSEKDQKIQYYKDKCFKLDDTVIVNEMKIKKHESVLNEYLDQIADLNKKLEKLLNKYTNQKAELSQLEQSYLTLKQSSSRSLNPNFIASIVFSLIFTYLFSRYLH